MSDFADLDLSVHYRGTSVIRTEFLMPVLNLSVNYDRLTGYFDTNALLAISQGIESVWRRQGKMRLVMGLHDVSRDILLAHQEAQLGQAEKFISLEKRLLEEAASLEDEMERDRIAAVGWMLQSGLLQVKVAEPISAGANFIFHSKQFVFRDELGRVISATGSPNETKPGHSGNYEDLTVFTSWGADPRYTLSHVDHFEAVWSNCIPDLNVQGLSADFASRLLEALDWPENKVPLLLSTERNLSQLIESIQQAPHLGHLCYPAVRLYPHQERALFDGLNRDSLRVLLADEVGLGKTLEAGALISHAVKFGGIPDVCILAPASLLTQFQDELFIFFNLDFYVWDSGAKQYFNSQKAPFRSRPFRGPLDHGAPKFKIISAQLARGAGVTNSIFQGVKELPTLLVVDEAHAARINSDGNGVKPTRLWSTLHEVADKIQHLILMTATPLQVQPLEFHGLLLLLGLPGAWQSRANYLRSLDILGGSVVGANLQDSNLVAKLVLAMLKLVSLDSLEMTSRQKELCRLVQNAADNSQNGAAIVVHKNWSDFLQILVLVHPANFLVIRNTRRGLEQLGYKFPQREFEVPQIQASEELASFFSLLDNYLDRHFGLVELAADPSNSNGIGFAKSGYQQRLASSVAAAFATLSRRLEKIKALENSISPIAIADYLVGPEDDDDASDPGYELSGDVDIRSQVVAHAAAIEKAILQDLISALKAIPGGLNKGDPKFKVAADIIKKVIGDEKVLVFSRYTDTLSAFTQYLEAELPELKGIGFGVYTGQESWISLDGVKVDVSKQDLKKALDSGRVRLVICSDAASEGLNLQAARRLINIDVPWNPARLEQRIGRIARLGQKAQVVFITNLWYPDSVEGLMYSRLQQRKNLYELAVGEFPEIVGKAIRDHARVRASGSSSSIDLDAIQQLEEARQSAQSKALRRVWDIEKDSKSKSDEVYDSLEILLGEMGVSVDGIVPPVTLGNIGIVSSSPMNDHESNEASLYAARKDGFTWGFAVQKSQKWYVLKSTAVVEIIRAMSGNSPLTSSQVWWPCQTQAEAEAFISKAMAADFPGHVPSAIKLAVLNEFLPWSSRLSGLVSLEKLGSIPMEGD